MGSAAFKFGGLLVVVLCWTITPLSAQATQLSDVSVERVSSGLAQLEAEQTVSCLLLEGGKLRCKGKEYVDAAVIQRTLQQSLRQDSSFLGLDWFRMPSHTMQAWLNLGICVGLICFAGKLI